MSSSFSPVSSLMSSFCFALRSQSAVDSISGKPNGGLDSITTVTCVRCFGLEPSLFSLGYFLVAAIQKYKPEYVICTHHNTEALIMKCPWKQGCTCSPMLQGGVPCSYSPRHLFHFTRPFVGYHVLCPLGFFYLTSAKEVIFSLLTLFVCKKAYTKTTWQNTMKLGGRMWCGSRNNTLHFGADVDQEVDPVLFFSFLNIVREGIFHHFHHFPRKKFQAY